MSNKQFYTISIVALITTFALAIAGQFYQSASLLFNVMLTTIGVLAGIVTSLYFAKRQERENLGKFASSAYRLSTNVHDSLAETIESIEQAAKTKDAAKSQIFSLRLEEIAKKLRLIQRFALAANDNWRDILPPEQLSELGKKESQIAVTFPLSEDHAVRITEQKIPLKPFQKR